MREGRGTESFFESILLICPFEKCSYYVMPLSVRPSRNFSFPDNSSYSLHPIKLKIDI